LIYQQRWASRHDAELAVFSWIEGWYNPEPIQAALGMLSPDEFEVAAAGCSPVPDGAAA
jgi:putative transposase